jgi:DNA-binding HxlR family transcriptional regulator
MSKNRTSCDLQHRGICAVEMQEALRCLEGRWKMMILSHLFAGPVLRFSDLQRAIPGVSQKMLIQQLSYGTHRLEDKNHQMPQNGDSD